MIVFELKCKHSHEFEAWFPSSDAFVKQQKARNVICPICGDKNVEKALMAPSVSGTKKKNKDSKKLPKKAQQKMGQYVSALKEIRAQVEKNCDYVGEKFPEEARKMYYGETEQHNIYGEATEADAEALNEEGIEFQQIPWVQNSDA